MAIANGHGGLLVGLEGGGGVVPARANAGITLRSRAHEKNDVFSYLELDPWLLVGGSIGVGYGTATGVQPVLGIWEGLPILGDDCGGDWGPVATVSVGYRYSGVHELYVAPKAGAMDSICLD